MMSLSGLNKHDHSSFSQGSTTELAAVLRMACESKFKKLRLVSFGKSTLCIELSGGAKASDGEGTISLGLAGAPYATSVCPKNSVKLQPQTFNVLNQVTCCLVNKRREKGVHEVWSKGVTTHLSPRANQMNWSQCYAQHVKTSSNLKLVAFVTSSCRREL
jgi:hypothetical protein